MSKKIARSITLSQDVIDKIKELCPHSKAFSSKAEELLKIGIMAYENGARLKTSIVGLKTEQTSQEKVEQKSTFNSKFLG